MTPVVESLEDARHLSWRGVQPSWVGARSGGPRVVSRAVSEANGLPWVSQTERRRLVSSLDVEPKSSAPKLASSDDLADAPGDQLARARCAAVRRAAACLDYAVPDDFTQVADWLQQRAADGA